MTDIAGSTGLWLKNREAMSRRITMLDDLVLREAAAAGGSLVRERGEGDSHFAVFPSVDGALTAASAIFKELDGNPDFGGMRLRAAVHAGEAEPRAGDFYGSTINRCARIREVAQPGQILVSEVARLLATGDGFRHLGSHRLRDMPRPERLYQLLHPALPSDFGTLRSLSTGAHNLPVHLSPIVGRTDEIRNLSRAIRDNRLTTVTGSGGVGKTRLAVHVAAKSVERFEGGIWFVDLCRTIRPEAVVGLIRETMSVTDATEEALISSIGDQHLLLVFDNCEHLAGECKRLAKKLLASCPNMHVLATSRRALQLVGEHVFRLDGMSSGGDGVKLFYERAADKGVRLESSPAAEKGCAALCEMLDGLPLAIEIAACASDVLTVTEISSLIGEFLDREAAEEGSKPYSLTLAATIDWSCQLLTKPAKKLLGRLTAFPTSWTLEEATAICAFGPVHASQMFGLTSELVAHSLIFVYGQIGDHKRFGMLQMTRQVLRRGKKRSEILDQRFAAHFGKVSELAQKATLDGRELVAYNLLGTEYENVEKALMILFRESPEAAFTMAENVRDYWLRSSHVSRGKHWFEVVSQSPQATDQTRAKALNAFAGFLIRGREYAPAQKALESAESILREEGGWEWARVLGNQAVLWSKTDRLAESAVAFEECARLFRTLFAPRDEALALLNLGVVEMRLYDNKSRCRETFMRSLALAQSIGSASMKANAYSSLAGVDHLTGHLAEALGHCRQALQLYQDGPWLAQTAWTMVNLNQILFDLGEISACLNTWFVTETLAQLAGSCLSPRQRKLQDDMYAQLCKLSPREELDKAEDAASLTDPRLLISMALDASAPF